VPNTDTAGPVLIEAESECQYLKIIRIDGPLFFGAVNHVSDYLYNIDKNLMRKRNVLIIGCGINFIDVAGAELLAQEAKRRRGQRGGLYLCEFQHEAYRVLERGGYLDVIGKEHIFTSQKEAIAKIIPKVDEMTCRSCKKHLFRECPNIPVFN